MSLKFDIHSRECVQFSVYWGLKIYFKDYPVFGWSFDVTQIVWFMKVIEAAGK